MFSVVVQTILKYKPMHLSRTTG